MFTRSYTFLKHRCNSIIRGRADPLWLLGPNSLYLATGIALFLFCLWGGGFFALFHNQRGVEEVLSKLEAKTAPFCLKKKKKEAFLTNFKGSHEGYLQEQLEPLRFLDKDIEVLTRLERERGDDLYFPIQERLKFLLSGQNTISLVKLSEKKTPSYKEIEWGLLHPVEVSYPDLQNILTIVEVGKGKHPQLFFKKFSLFREDPLLFHLDFTIIQRSPHA